MLLNAEHIIDVTRSLDRTLKGRLPTGVDRVILEYVRYFRPSARALVRFGGRWIVSSSSFSNALFDALLDPSLLKRHQVFAKLAQDYVLNWKIPAPGSILLNLGHSGLQDAEYGRRVQKLGWNAFYFLHDLIPITHAEYCRAGEADHHHRRVHTMLMTGCGLIANSAATARELAEYAREGAMPVPRCAVAHLAPGRLPIPSGQRPLPMPYFVMLGTIEPRKNHLLLLHAWRNLVERLGERAPRLVIIGQRGWECEQVIDLLDRCNALRDFVLERPACGDAELATWLAHAQALLFPSFAEGYGMPLVEALVARLPVLASDLPAFREVAADIPEYLDPLDGLGWVRAIEEYALPDSMRRKAQLARMHGWQAPTWEAHFWQVQELMQRCLPAASA